MSRSPCRLFLGPCRGVSSAILLATLTIVAPASSLRAQDQDQLNDLLKIWAHHPLTGEVLPAETAHPVRVPYPIRGKVGDGEPDKLPYSISLEWEAPDYDGAPSADEIGNDLLGPATQLRILVGQREYEGDDWPVDVEVGRNYRNDDMFRIDPGQAFSRRMRGTGLYWDGEIDLPFDVMAETILLMRAVLERDGVVIDSVTTEIRPGMPELRFRSTIISENMGDMEGLRITGTVAGRTGLEFDEGYLTLSGRGEVTYEDFHIEARGASPIQACTFFTSTRGGYFRAREVVLFRDALPPLVPAPDPGAPLAVAESVFGIEPGIEESVRISCPNSPVDFPLPNILHFFAGFYSIHGGEVDGEPNEMDEARGGLVMTGWEAGEGDVIATRTYDRQGPVGPGTLIEETVLELVWVR